MQSSGVGVELPMEVEDAHGNHFLVENAYIVLYPMGIGILRFAVRALGSISIQTALDVLNSVRRLKVRCRRHCCFGAVIVQCCCVVIIVAMTLLRCALSCSCLL